MIQGCAGAVSYIKYSTPVELYRRKRWWWPWVEGICIQWTGMESWTGVEPRMECWIEIRAGIELDMNPMHVYSVEWLMELASLAL